MTSWHSLAGYLVYRPTGPLGRLQCRRRWFVFDEDRCQLLSFKCELDPGQKKPLGTIEIRGSAIALHSAENQFIIHSNGKSHILLAENHESMMIWLLALQAKRDAFNNSFSAIVEQGCLTRCEEAEKRKESLLSDHEMRTMIMHALRAEARTPSARLTCSNSSHLSSRALSCSGELEDGGSSSCDGLSSTIHNNRRSTVPCYNPRSPRCLSCLGSIVDGPWSCPLPSPLSDNDDRLSFELSTEAGTETKVEVCRKLSDNSTASCKSDNGDGNRCRELENELIATKCELAKVLNRESSLKNTLNEKDELIGTLEERAYHSDSATLEKTTSPRLHEKCRILQNQNQFLNEEVLKLSRMWQQEQVVVNQTNHRIEELEDVIKQLKRDYVLLLQSTIRIPACEGPEIMEVPLFGGNRHRERVSQLVEEARKQNPSLPTYEGLTKAGSHVDGYGFRQVHVNDGLTLHYLCRQLKQHYNAQLVYTDRHQMDWKELLNANDNRLPQTKEMKKLVRKGIPCHLRSRVWVSLVRQRVKDIAEAKGSHYYSQLVSVAPDSQTVAQYRRQIALDLLRTMPNNIHFNDTNADGVKKMQEVLLAFCHHNPKVGYCQGMNFIAGMALLFMEPEDAFWCLVAVTECYFLPHYFDQNLLGAQSDQEVLKELLKDKLPHLSQHFATHEIELCTVTLNWFLAIFFDCVPFESLLRIWDCFLSEGPKVLFRFTLALLKLRESPILHQKDAVAIMKQIKAAARLCFDVDGLMKVAFEDLKPFPRRADITSKQACYQKALKESYKKLRRERQALEKKEKVMYDILSVNDNNLLAIECATVFEGDKLWLCQGHQHLGQVIKVNGGENIMYNLNIEFDSRIMCIQAVNNNIILLGTLSHQLYAFNAHSRDKLWELKLNDAALDLCSIRGTSETNFGCRAFTALADGTVAVIDNVDKLFERSPSCFYVQIFSGPLMCLQLINEQLWCASGNKVTILNPQTMDTTDQFYISSNVMDIISKMVESDYGVWISVRGSSIIQVWDPSALICKMMFDTRDHKYPHGSKDDDLYNPLRVTCLLPFSNSLWIGTADGTLLIFDITNRIINRTPASDCSPHSEKAMNLLEEYNLSSQDHQTFEAVFNDDSDDKNCPVLPDNKPVRDRSDSGYQTVGLEFTQHRLSWDCAGSTHIGYCSSSTVKGSSSMEFSPRPSCDATNVTSFSFNHSEDKIFCNDAMHQTSTHCNGSKFENGHDVEGDDMAAIYCGLDSLPKIQGKVFPKTPVPNRRHSLAVPDVGSLQPLNELSVSTSDGAESCKNNTVVNETIEKTCPVRGSFDSVSHLLTGSHESILSSSMADSFEYEDVFIAYTEDERSLSAEPQLTNAIEMGVRYAEELMKTFQLPLKTVNGPNHVKQTSNCVQKHCVSSYKTNSSSDLNHNHVRSSRPKKQTSNSVETSANNQENEGEMKSQWSSFDDMSTPSNVEYDSLQDSQPPMDYLKLTTNLVSPMSKSSDSGSYVSFASSDVPYMLELTMKEKIKIADQPIKVLLALRCNDEESIISCSGSCRDDESVLRWSIEGEEKLWTNDPIVEVCPYTNKVKPSAYIRSRLPRRSSSIISTTTFTTSRSSNSSQECDGRKQIPATTRSRMQSLFAAMTSDK